MIKGIQSGNLKLPKPGDCKKRKRWNSQGRQQQTEKKTENLTEIERMHQTEGRHGEMSDAGHLPRGSMETYYDRLPE